MVDIAELEIEIAHHVNALGFDLVRVKYFGPADDKTLQIMAERPDTRQLHIDDCAQLLHRISDWLDQADPIGEPYRLEVSSPGIDRPLTRERDFVDWAGHEARLNLIEKINGRKQVKGVIIGIEDGVIALDDSKGERIEIGFTSLHSAKLKLTDKLIAASVPIDTSGVEEIVEDASDDDISDDEAPEDEALEEKALGKE